MLQHLEGVNRSDFAFSNDCMGQLCVYLSLAGSAKVEPCTDLRSCVCFTCTQLCRKGSKDKSLLPV